MFTAPNIAGNFYIKNNSKNTVLTVRENLVLEEAFIEGSPSQLWTKRQINPDEFFTIVNTATEKMLTAATVDKLEARGMYSNSFLLRFLHDN